jgi:DNA repair photolyase
MPPSIQYEPITCKTILNDVKAPSMPFEKSINPYRGCQHGCSFCYARSTHSFLGMEADDSFQNHILLKANAAEALEEQIKKKLRSGKGMPALGRIAIGTATDPYQPIEGKMLLTRKCLEVLAKYQLPTSITTRSPLILRDLDILKQIPITSVNISLSTLNQKVWRDMEPATPFPMKRLETVQRLQENGIPAGLFVAPILPYLTDSEHELSTLFEQADLHKAEFMMTSFLRLSTSAVKLWFFQTLGQSYPELVEPYANLYRQSTSAPASYKAPIKLKIDSLRKQYGFQSFEATHLSAEQASLVVKEEAPIQLSFSF